MRVHNWDGFWWSRHALPVSGNTVLIPIGRRIIDDVDGSNPMVVNLDVLRRKAQEQ